MTYQSAKPTVENLCQLLRRVALVTALVGLGACATIYDNTIGLFEPSAPKRPTVAERNAHKPIQNQETGVNLEKLQPAATTGSIELIWKIPSEPFDGFNIHYGAARDSLNKTVTVPVAELEKFEDPERGFVFRYLLAGVPLDRPVYIAISAYSGNVESSLSSVSIVAPQRAQEVPPAKAESQGADSQGEQDELEIAH